MPGPDRVAQLRGRTGDTPEPGHLDSPAFERRGSPECTAAGRGSLREGHRMLTAALVFRLKRTVKSTHGLAAEGLREGSIPEREEHLNHNFVSTYLGLTH